MMKVNFREPSTKRGIVMTITGGIVLYQIFWGSGNADVDRILARVDWWLGIGLTIVGMLGLLPDRDPEKRTRETDVDQAPRRPLPPIELTGKSESVDEFPNIPPMAFDDSAPRSTNEWLHDPVPSEARFKHGIDPNKGSVGWNDDH